MAPAASISTIKSEGVEEVAADFFAAINIEEALPETPLSNSAFDGHELGKPAAQAS